MIKFWMDVTSLDVYTKHFGIALVTYLHHAPGGEDRFGFVPDNPLVIDIAKVRINKPILDKGFKI